MRPLLELGGFLGDRDANEKDAKHGDGGVALPVLRAAVGAAGHAPHLGPEILSMVRVISSSAHGRKLSLSLSLSLTFSHPCPSSSSSHLLPPFSSSSFFLNPNLPFPSSTAFPSSTSTLSMAPPSSNDLLKLRINQCFIKLSDRDTESMAATELESLAISLSSSSLPSFLSALSDTRPSDKPPLRRHSLRLLSLLARSHPPSLLLPHLPRMLSAALRRLRDPDSSVRAACVDAFRSLAALSLPSTGSLPSLLLHSLSDALLHEQDQCAQISASLSLAAAVDVAAGSPASAGSDLGDQLQRLVPRLVKLVRSNAFKAKPALISLLGSIAGAGGASTGTLLGVLVPCLVEFLSSEDWAVRKAAAEALSRVALSERDLLGGFRSSCLSSFESRKFDKVKIVRDSMNQMVKVWKDIPVAVVEDCNGASPLPDSNSKPSLRVFIGSGWILVIGSHFYSL